MSPRAQGAAVLLHVLRHVALAPLVLAVAVLAAILGAIYDHESHVVSAALFFGAGALAYLAHRLHPRRSSP